MLVAIQFLLPSITWKFIMIRIRILNPKNIVLNPKNIVLNPKNIVLNPKNIVLNPENIKSLMVVV